MPPSLLYSQEHAPGKPESLNSNLSDFFILSEIIKVAGSKNGKLKRLLKCSLNELKPSCLNHALLLAVQNTNYLNVHQLLLKGVTDLGIDNALPFVEDKTEHANMVLVKGVMTNDQGLVTALYESCQAPDAHLSLSELRKLACNLPLKISLARKDISVVQNLITGDDGTVANWSDLQISEQNFQLLSSISGVQSITALLLDKNKLTSLPLSITNFQQVGEEGGGGNAVPVFVKNVAHICITELKQCHT